MDNKKSIFSIICVILLIVNVVLTGVVIFFTVPANNKMNNLLTLIITELNLDQEKTEDGQIPMSQSISLNLTDEDGLIPIQINLKSDTGSKNHMISITAGVVLNSKAKDYETISAQITSNTGVVVSHIRNTVMQYTYEQIATDVYAPIIEEEVAKVLREKFDTDTILDVYFIEYIYN